MVRQTYIAYKNIGSKYGINFIANAGQQGLRFLLLYISAKVLGPKEFAAVSFIILMSSYLMNANLGAINGVKKQIPLFYLKRGEGFTLNAFFSILNFNWLTTIIISVAVAILINAYYGYGLISSILLIILSLSVNTYFSAQTYFTSTANWRNLFQLQSICALLLAGAILSLFFSDYLILLAAYTGSFLVAGLLFFIKNGYRARLNKDIIMENLGVGFPVMISGFIYLVFQTTDRLIVSHYYSDLEFGYYSFAWVLVMSLNLLTNLSSEIILQKSATRFAQLSDQNDLLRFILKYSILVQVILIGVSFLLLGVVQYAIPIYLDEYKPAISIINNIVIAYLIQSLAIGPAIFYYIIGRQLMYNLLLASSCILNALILLYPIIIGSHLPSVEVVSGLYIWSSCVYVSLLYLPVIKKLRS